MDLEKIEIAKSPTSSLEQTDSGTLMMSTKMHIVDVRKGLEYIISKLKAAADFHDHTKLEYFNEFLTEYNKAAETKKWPTGSDSWFEKYHLLERHHINDRAPDDINLIDVIEMLVDCVMAGKARSGEYKPGNEPSAELLLKAYKNTAEQLAKNIEVKEHLENKPKMVSVQGFNFKISNYGESRDSDYGRD